MIGSKFFKLTVVSQAKEGKNFWLCECECGNYKTVKKNDLLRSHYKSCGCLRNNIGFRTKKHGKTGSVEYRAWKGMKTRCYNKNNGKFKNYGARGIVVCDRWKDSFDNFLSDMGERPSKEMSLERLNVNKGYEPDNCIWADATQQARNKTSSKIINTPLGEMSLAEAAEKFNINYNTLKSRLKYGFTGEKLFAVNS